MKVDLIGEEAKVYLSKKADLIGEKQTLVKDIGWKDIDWKNMEFFCCMKIRR